MRFIFNLFVFSTLLLNLLWTILTKISRHFPKLLFNLAISDLPAYPTHIGLFQSWLPCGLLKYILVFINLKIWPFSFLWIWPFWYCVWPNLAIMYLYLATLVSIALQIQMKSSPVIQTMFAWQKLGTFAWTRFELFF